MPTLTETLYSDLLAPSVILPDIDEFNGGRSGYQSTGNPAPIVSGIGGPQNAIDTPEYYHLPSLPVQGVGGVGSTGMVDGRTVEPGYGYWNTHAPFMAQGYYDAVPDTASQPVTGRGTPNVHAKSLLAGVNTLLAQYNPDPYTYSAAYVGALTPQTIPVGYGGVQA